MIRIIGGKRYDTDTATEIHSFISLGVGYDTVTETLHLSPLSILNQSQGEMRR